MDTPAPSPHAAYDRYIRQQERWVARGRRFGQIVFYVFGAVMAVALAILLVVYLIDLGQPRLWGTFTQTECQPTRRGCSPVGTWVSDDGALVVRDVFLNGWTDQDGTVRAGYQPTTLLSGESNDVVDTVIFAGAGPLIVGAALLWWLGVMFFKAADWGDVPVPRRLAGRRRGRRATQRAELRARGSLRRAYRRSLEESMPVEDASGGRSSSHGDPGVEAPR